MLLIVHFTEKIVIKIEIMSYKGSIRIGIKKDVSYYFPSDAAKSENTPEGVIMYSVLASDGNMTVKFRMNPVSNFAVYWSIGGLVLANINVGNNTEGEHAQTTYFISNVTKEQLGNYTVRVINWAITSEPNEVTFNVILKLPGKKSKAIFLCPYNLIFVMFPYV